MARRLGGGVTAAIVEAVVQLLLTGGALPRVFVTPHPELRSGQRGACGSMRGRALRRLSRTLKHASSRAGGSLCSRALKNTLQERTLPTHLVQ